MTEGELCASNAENNASYNSRRPLENIQPIGETGRSVDTDQSNSSGQKTGSDLNTVLFEWTSMNSVSSIYHIDHACASGTHHLGQ